MINSAGQVIRMDATGNVLKTFTAGQVTLAGLEVLPNGRVLIAHYSNNLVAEYDAEGTKVWEARLTQPSSATRLPNGNTLVACTQGTQQVVEVDRAGNVVWEHKTTNQRPWKVRRR
jgi:outer membrane protein assembly factor BamB